LIDAATGDDNLAQGEPEWFKKDRNYTPNPFPGELYNLHDDLGGLVALDAGDLALARVDEDLRPCTRRGGDRLGKMNGQTSLDRFQGHCKWEISVQGIGMRYPAGQLVCGAASS